MQRERRSTADAIWVKPRLNRERRPCRGDRRASLVVMPVETRVIRPLLMRRRERRDKLGALRLQIYPYRRSP